jgi:hypothetical protein
VAGRRTVPGLCQISSFVISDVESSDSFTRNLILILIIIIKKINLSP